MASKLGVQFLLALSLCLLVSKAQSQSKEIDSLTMLIEKTSDPQKKVELLNSLSFRFFDFDISKAEATTRQALEIAQTESDKKGEGWAIAYRGIYFFINGSLQEAESFFNQSLKIGQDIDNNDLILYSLTQLGNTFRDKGEFATAYDYYHRAQRAILKTTSDYYHSVVSMNLSRYFVITEQFDSALHYAFHTEALRSRLNDPLSLADAWMQIGVCYEKKDDYKKAETYFEKGWKQGKNDLLIKADYMQNMGEIYFRNGDFTSALKNWSEVLSLYRKYQYKYALAELLLRMGTVFEEQGFYDLSSEYLSNAIVIAEKAPYQYLLAEILHEQSWVYFRISNYELALVSSRKSEALFKKINFKSGVAGCWDLQGLTLRNLKRYDSALYFHTKSLEERQRLGNKVDISASLFNTGEFYSRIKKFDEAMPYYRKSLTIDSGIGDNYGISLNYNRIGRIFNYRKRYDSALRYFNESLTLAIPMSANEIFRDNYMDLSNYYAANGKPYQALSFQKKYIQLSDSIFSKQTAQSLASYRTLYDVERNEQQIALLNKDNELNKARLQKQRILLYSSIGGVIILALISAFYFRFSKQLKKLNIDLAEKNEEVQAQAEELVEANEALSTLNKNIAEQKEEIQAQAEELTESNQVISRINEELEERIEARTAELKQAFKELDTFFYRSSHDFRRPLTTFMGLAEVARVLVKDKTALELFEKVQENAVNLDKMLRKLQSISDVGSQEVIYKEVFIRDLFDIELDKVKEVMERKKIVSKISIEVSHPFYSYPALIKIIIENLLENATAFSTGANPVIQLKAFEEDHQIVLQVADNGMGIDPVYQDRVFDMYFRANEYSTGNGLGLYIVKKMVQKLNGRVLLKSELGNGTTVTIYFPQRLE